MDKISDVSVEEMGTSRFIRPFRMRYKQDGVAKAWDLIKCHASVHIVIYNKSSKKLVFVKVWRKPLHFSFLKLGERFAL